MSTLVAQTLSNGTVSTSTANCIRGSARAWVLYNGVASTINASYNVTSVTKNGTGDYTVNFTTSFADANYVVTGQGSGNPTDGRFQFDAFSVRTASAYRFITTNSAQSLTDSTSASVAFFR